MKKTLASTAIAFGALGVVCAQMLDGVAPNRDGDLFDRGAARLGAGELSVKADWIGGARPTGELTATGHVQATSGAFRFLSDRVARSEKGVYDFGHQALLSTCTNELHDLHWHLRGDFLFEDPGADQKKAFWVRDAWLFYEDVPVMWVPIWYQPINTNYGWRFTPGYTSRNGGTFLSGYVYPLVGDESNPDAFSLGASTYADYRTENGFAVGQTLRWNLKEWGHGKIRAFYAWDDDYDRYSRHWRDAHHYNYQNWGSDVDRERYRIVYKHSADLTERDVLRVQGSFLSDSHVVHDFFRDDHHYESTPVNEAWYEHRENSWAAGGSISGPVDDFYAGTARLPEGWLAIEPQPIWELPANYESQTRAGYLNRDFSEYGSHDPMYRYGPYIGLNGRGADYQAFRADTAHRITLPMKFGDVLSVVPRANYRCTWWSDSGDRDTGYLTAADDAVARNVVEVGFTASARGSAWLDENWKHTFEPYLDYSFQKVSLSSNGKSRYYVFDNYDRSVDWLDQFGFEGRGLPYDWHGIRPGVRNYFQRTDDRGYLRTIADTDFYLAVPFEDESAFSGGVLRGYPKDDEKNNYRTDCVVPGTRLAFHPTKDLSFGARAEYDCDEEKVAYASLSLRQQLTQTLSWNAAYIGRDHRIWDYLPSEYDRYNYELANILHVGFTHTVCDWFAWSPYIREDCRRNEVEEVGAWFDFLQDCLGYRVSVSYEDGFTRVDGSKYESEVDVGFFIYLRALGPSSSMDLIKF